MRIEVYDEVGKLMDSIPLSRDQAEALSDQLDAAITGDEPEDAPLVRIFEPVTSYALGGVA